jgi:hypothetical protein
MSKHIEVSWAEFLSFQKGIGYEVLVEDAEGILRLKYIESVSKGLPLW